MSDRFVFFWLDHQENGEFSNWYHCQFQTVNGRFLSTEQYFMYYKAVVFKNYELAAKIMTMSNQKDIKDAGREVTPFDADLWFDISRGIMMQGLRAKFHQNRDLYELLIGTGDKIMAESSPYDKIWGIGLAADDSHVEDVNHWNGYNFMGKLLMKLRTELRQWYEVEGDSMFEFVDYRHNDLMTQLMDHTIDELYQMASIKDIIHTHIMFISIGENISYEEALNRVAFKTLDQCLDDYRDNPHHAYGFHEMMQELSDLLRAHII